MVAAAAADDRREGSETAGARAPRRADRTRGTDMSASAVSDRGRAANRANAETSTGPRTSEGNARAARNSTSHGIFCRDLVLSGEDEQLFRRTRESFIRSLKPQDCAQLAMVDGMVAARWRMNRCEVELIEQRIHTTVKNAILGKCPAPGTTFDDFATALEIATNGLASRAWSTSRRGDDRADPPPLTPAAGREIPPGDAVAVMLDSVGGPLERVSRYQHRLEQSFHRCLRDLQVLKQKAKEYADEPDSPFWGEAVEEAEETTPSSRYSGQRAGGAGERGETRAESDECWSAPETEPDSVSSIRCAAPSSFECAVEQPSHPTASRVALAESDSVRGEDERAFTPGATDPSPQPSPPGTRKREQIGKTNPFPAQVI